MTIGARVKGSRLAAGFPIAAEFARYAGVSKQWLKNVEGDAVSKPDPSELVKVARASNVSLEWLVTGDGLPARVSSITDDESNALQMLRALSNDKRKFILTALKSVSESDE